MDKRRNKFFVHYFIRMISLSLFISFTAASDLKREYSNQNNTYKNSSFRLFYGHELRAINHSDSPKQYFYPAWIYCDSYCRKNEGYFCAFIDFDGTKGRISEERCRCCANIHAGNEDVSQNQLFQKNSEILVLKSKMNPNEVENYLPFSNVPKDDRGNHTDDWILENEDDSIGSRRKGLIIRNKRSIDSKRHRVGLGQLMGDKKLVISSNTTIKTRSIQENQINHLDQTDADELPDNFRRVYSKWTKWSNCSPKCITKRFKKCKIKEICGNEVLREIAYCYTEGSFCQSWINNQVKNHPSQSKLALTLPQLNAVHPPVETLDINPSESTSRNQNYMYTPKNIKCGIPAIGNKPKPMLMGMLKIIGGKTSRKGQWPWQVAILNRHKESFCGGSLVSPLWILSAAHCVRKKLYARLGEHNLDVVDKHEIEYQIDMAIKHPKYNRRTVDNDVAMLRLPQEVEPSMFIGFACLPHRYQEFPTSPCTIIGWGKRKDSDDTGTSILHEAKVPIISDTACKTVYRDYTITKNMFCAGHRRGRIDTCAGDSGGPLLCRDTTKQNEPWTIFGITSFGDGCGKRNKFGIYVKLSNYVDWIWSVINCNGNCNTTPMSSPIVRERRFYR